MTTLTKKDLLDFIESESFKSLPMSAEIWLMTSYNVKPLERIVCGEKGIDLC